MGWMAEWSEFVSRNWQDFSPINVVQTEFGIKRLGREADHSPPISSEVKNTQIYISKYVFMA
jgi:hypothetical protein